MPDKPFFAYFAPGRHPRAAPRAEGVGRQVQGQVRPGLGHAARGDVRPPEGARRRSRRTATSPSAARASRPGTTSTDELKPVLARQMEVYAGFLENTDHHVGLLIDALEDLRDPRRHADLRDHRRQRRLGRGLAAGHVQRDDHARRLRARSRRPSSCRRRSTSSAGPRPTTTTPSAGRTRWTRRTSGPSRSRRTGAAPATARSCTGRAASRRKGEIRIAVPPRHRRRPDRPRGRRAAAPDAGQRRAAEADRGREHGLLVRRRRRRRAPRDAVLRDVRQPRHLPQGLDGGDQAPHARGRPARTSTPPAFDDDVWELYDTTTDWTQAHDLAQGAPGQAARAAAPVADRGGQVQRRAARRPLRRARPARDRRPADADPGQAPAAVRRHGPADRELGA